MIPENKKSIKLHIRFAGWISRISGEEVLIKLNKDANIYDLFSEFLRLYKIAEKYYDEHLGWIHTLFGFLVFKNGRVIGRFSKDKLEIIDELHNNIVLKDGDEITILPLAGGG